MPTSSTDRTTPPAALGWEFWVDRGGTFTDIVGRAPDGRLHTAKLLSNNPERYEDAALEGMRRLLCGDESQPLPVERIGAVKMGTTVATNALLERKGTPTLLVTTHGHRDALIIGYQNRPRLFDLDIVRPTPLHTRTVEAIERVRADGTQETPLDEAALRRDLQAAYDDGLRACAICFLHADRHPEHERIATRIARDAGFTQISVSHAVSPMMKLIPRGDTTVVDAYLSPVLRRYIDLVADRLEADGKGPALYFMQSNGGLVDAGRFQGKDAILSGPAGGVVGMAEVARIAGLERVIGFDMGGTSTDVSLFNGAYERSFLNEISGVRVRAPMMQIHTVAAGGGSIIDYDGARLRVGPHSAGADPGPACYRRGGPLTVTDANAMTGKLVPEFFPAVFGPREDQPIDVETVRAQFEDLARRMGATRTPEEIAEGCIAIAVESMALAIKKISVARGHDVQTFALVSFGGAASQHACLVAEALGIRTVLIHPLSGILSAYGMGLADIRAIRERGLEVRLAPETHDEITATGDEVAREAVADIRAQGIAADAVSTVRRLHLRYHGTDTALLIPTDDLAGARAAFEDAHHQRFGFTMPGKQVMVEAVSVEAVGTTHKPEEPALPLQDRPAEDIPVSHRTRIFTRGGWHECPVHRRAELLPGDRIEGPAIIAEPHATVIVEPGWAAQLSAHDHILLDQVAGKDAPHAVEPQMQTSAPDPVRLEIFNNLFMSIAEQMGVALENTATSVNIKERLDFSCALFNSAGDLIANAPHIPVHLGSMGDSVRAVIERTGGHMARGDVFMLNDPYNGGTHLPDITVIMPVFDECGEIAFYTAARGHHADVGGITPGSMPSDSRHIDEEGILFDCLQVVREGTFLEDSVRAHLTSGRWPARNPDQNIADLTAQIAACTRGAQDLMTLVKTYGHDTVEAYMGHILDNAETAVRTAIGKLEDGQFTYDMDSGNRIEVSLHIDREKGHAEIDFTGTSSQSATNFNAPHAIVRAATLYAFRCLVEDDIPLNDGCLRPIRLTVPRGTMVNPDPPAAVVAGNVEVSQAVTNALFGLLGRLASSQGTMNNLTFGNDAHQYYETICGGAGASARADGADAVQTHMTNSRLTDPEVMETRFPVLLERFEIREGSGGAGRHTGGNGVIRSLRFLEPMTVSLLTGHREVPNQGLQGGYGGALGRNTLTRADDTTEALPGCARADLAAGDRLTIETPGGGGFGAPPNTEDTS